MIATTSIVPIVEVIRPAEQGSSTPYLCLGADGRRYYVKAQQTNRSSLWAEWICAHLAQALELPIAPFGLVQLDSKLVKALPKSWQSLGSLPAFGSCEVAQTTWFEMGNASRVPIALQHDILVFDLWVQNIDRLQGNTNLLWSATTQTLVVIDHNLALHDQFSRTEVIAQHVFAAQWQSLADNADLQADYAKRLASAIPAARYAIDTAPQAWLWENSEFDLPTRFDVHNALRKLDKHNDKNFWSAP